MIIKPIHHIWPGGAAYVSEDRSILKLRTPDKEWLFGPLFDMKRFQLMQHLPSEDVKFIEICSVPPEATKPMSIALVQLNRDNDISAEGIRMLELGAHYKVDLGEAKLDQILGKKIEATVFFLTRATKNSCLGLATLNIENEGSIGEDENIVAVLDILGFSEINRTCSLEELEKKIINGLLGSVRMTEFLSAGAFAFDKDGSIPVPDEASQVTCGVISDTIVLFPRHTGGNPLRVICEAVINLLDCALTMEWLLRGAIDIDSFRAIPDHNIYIGKALVGAHELEHSLEWSGCVLSPRIVERFSDEVREMKKDGLIVDYDIPIKGTSSGSSITKMLPINWFYYQNNENRHHQLKKLQKRAPEKAQRKIDNTIKFYMYLNSKGLTSIKPLTMQAFHLDNLEPNEEEDNS